MFSHDHERRQRQAEEKSLEETELLAEQKALHDKLQEDLAYQKKQMDQLDSVSVGYRVLYRLSNIVLNIVNMAQHSLGLILKILPPVNAFVSGIFLFVELIEILFLSKEERSQRAVRAFNSIAGTGLTIAGTVLLFNPATAPLGTLFAAIAMGLSTIKEGFIWYKANKNYNKIAAAYKAEKNLQHTAISQFVKQHCSYELTRIQHLTAEINKIENSPTTPNAKTRSLLIELRHQKQTLLRQINFQINSQQDFYQKRKTVNRLKKEMQQAATINNNARKDFYLTAVSFLGIAALATASILVAAAVISNPVGLSVLGMGLLAYATVRGAIHYFGKNKPQAIRPSVTPPNSNALQSKHLSDTEVIVRKLARNSRVSEEKILRSEIAADTPPAESKPEEIPDKKYEEGDLGIAPLHLPKLDKH